MLELLSKPLFSDTCTLRGWVTGVTYPFSLTSSFCVPPLLTCAHLSTALSISSSSSSSSCSSPAALLWLRTKLTCSSAQTRVDGHVNFVCSSFSLHFAVSFLSTSFCISHFVRHLFLTSAKTINIHIPSHSPPLHHLGSTLLYNGCSLADLLPPFFPLTSPPLTLSLREISPALGMLSKPPLPSTDPHSLWGCCGPARQQGKFWLFISGY